MVDSRLPCSTTRSFGSSAQTADDFFNGDQLHEIHLYVHPDDWAKLRENYLDNTYYDCTFVWRSGDYEIASEYVQVRSRGSGSRNQDKPGLRVDFDPFSDRPQRFLGLKSCVLDNLATDPSMLRERLSTKLFERLGLPVSREANTRLYVNDDYLGFTRSWNPSTRTSSSAISARMTAISTSTSGCIPTTLPIWATICRDRKLFPPRRMRRTPRRRTTVPRSHDRAINQPSDENFEASMAAYMDLRMFVTIVGVESFLSEADGILGYAGINNFYIYRFENTDQFQFIPWDMDNAFSSISNSIWDRVNENALMRQALEIPEIRSAFMESLLFCADAAGGPEESLEAEVEREYQQIRDAAIEDPYKPYSNEDFEAAVNFLRQFARERSSNVWYEVIANLPQP